MQDEFDNIELASRGAPSFVSSPYGTNRTNQRDHYDQADPPAGLEEEIIVSRWQHGQQQRRRAVCLTACAFTLVLLLATIVPISVLRSRAGSGSDSSVPQSANSRPAQSTTQAPTSQATSKPSPIAIAPSTTRRTSQPTSRPTPESVSTRAPLTAPTSENRPTPSPTLAPTSKTDASPKPTPTVHANSTVNTTTPLSGQPTQITPGTRVPTKAPAQSSTQSLDSIRSLLLNRSVSTADNLLNTSSAQYKAMAWLANEQPILKNASDATIAVERFILAVVYYGTNGANWTSQRNFLSPSSVCAWQGVSCNDNQQVQYLDLRNNSLSGTIPVELSKLDALYSLFLGRNKLVGTIPSGLALQQWIPGVLPVALLLREKRLLDLSYNSLTGNVPDSYAVLDQKQRGMGRLFFDHNNITGNLTAALCGPNPHWLLLTADCKRKVECGCCTECF